MLKVPPTISFLKFFFYHYIMILNVDTDQIIYIHLKKYIFRKKCEIVDISLKDISKNFNFRNGIFIHLIVSDDQLMKKHLFSRIQIILLRNQIPYGIKSKYSFNCESLIYYLLFGTRIESVEVRRFEAKFGRIGSFLIFLYDQLLIYTNFIGEIHFFFTNESSNK